jgi:subtilisin-like proprotein convertase family protein
MKTLKSIMAAVAAAVLGLSLPAQAAIDFTSTGGGGYSASDSGLNQIIQDNSDVGVGYSLNFGASGLNISDVSVTFNISGGYDGNIYAYLSHGSTEVVLLDHITGAANSSGFNVTLIDGTGNSIQTASGTAGQPLTGVSYTADQNLAAFNNTDPNGSWTLFFADEGAGDAPTLNSFNVSLDAVPEPVNMALGIFGGLMGVVAVARSKRVKQFFAGKTEMVN